MSLSGPGSPKRGTFVRRDSATGGLCRYAYERLPHSVPVSYLFAFLGFAALIILHEFGHFAAAKAVGMRVERFSLFFGPLLVKKKIGETEYGIGPIPLGGYVRITGMNPNEEIPPEAAPRAYFNQPVWKRCVVILAGPAVNLLIAFVIVWALYLSQGQTVVSKNGQPVVTQQVAAVEPGTPAARVLRAGDQVVAVDGVGGSADAIRNQIDKHRCAGAQVDGCVSATPATVAVRRDGERLTFKLRPQYNATAGRMLVGFEFGEQTAPVGAARAASLTVTGLWGVTTQTVSKFATLFEPQSRKSIHSVVGAYTVTQRDFSTSTTLALQLLALISLSLAVINLFPFLPLDGGHVFWALAEKVRGKRIPFEVMERASAVGFAVILIVFVIGLSNDVSTLAGNGVFH
jgi:regulator of sigma E protease